MSVFSEAITDFLKPIKTLLDDDSISEVMVNGPDRIYVEKGGKILKTKNKFKDNAKFDSIPKKERDRQYTKQSDSV